MVSPGLLLPVMVYATGLVAVTAKPVSFGARGPGF